MAGIYIHIPFCKQACHYCNFHFSTSLKYKRDMVDAIIEEVHQRNHELDDKYLSSIYFGGGTPSLLDENDLGDIFKALDTYFHWDSKTEITLEANPDDLTISKLQMLKKSNINRLSIGIQSFDEADLKYMNRAHSADEAEICIDRALDAGFEKITADLIYGSPTTSDETWTSNVEKMLSYKLPHISAYCLTVEEGTALHHFVANGKAAPVDNDKAIRQFNYLMDSLTDSGYDHYEISNFALPEKYAIHNTNYWKGKQYLGLGPAAHSYDGKNVRRWNVAHNAQYIKAVNAKNSFSEQEVLTASDRYNEYILTSLRTIWGIDTIFLNNTYPKLWSEQELAVSRLLENGLVSKKNKIITLTKEGKFLADNVSMQLFVE